MDNAIPTLLVAILALVVFMGTAYRQHFKPARIKDVVLAPQIWLSYIEQHRLLITIFVSLRNEGAQGTTLTDARITLSGDHNEHALEWRWIIGTSMKNDNTSGDVSPIHSVVDGAMPIHMPANDHSMHWNQVRVDGSV